MERCADYNWNPYPPGMKIAAGWFERGRGELLPSQRPPVRFLFDCFDHVQEAADVCRRDRPCDSALEIDQVILDLTCDLAAPGGERDDERPPIRHARFPGDEAALRQAIEDARQRRTFVGEALMKVFNGCRRLRRELREDVRLAL